MMQRTAGGTDDIEEMQGWLERRRVRQRRKRRFDAETQTIFITEGHVTDVTVLRWLKCIDRWPTCDKEVNETRLV